MQSSTSDFFLRKWQLILGSTGAPLGTPTPGAGGETRIPATQGPPASPNNSRVLSQETMGFDLRIRFQVHQANIETPNWAWIRVYNLSDDTAKRTINEFDKCILQAGYVDGRFGTIFAGNVKQYKIGHENAVDSYLDIYAADGDRAVYDAVTNDVLPAGTTPQQKLDKLAGTLKEHGVDKGYIDPQALVISPSIRDSVLFGRSADELRDFAAQNGARWSIDQGKLKFTGNTAYDPGDIVDLNAKSGLIGWPELTQDGVELQCLINPSIRLGQRIKLDNSQINQFLSPGGGPPTTGANVSFTAYDHFAPLSGTGTYCVFFIEYDGDSRGNPWYQTMICLTVDSTQPRGEAVSAGDQQSLPADVTLPAPASTTPPARRSFLRIG